jgi:inorganic triphosphatase YgiF
VDTPGHRVRPEQARIALRSGRRRGQSQQHCKTRGATFQGVIARPRVALAQDEPPPSVLTFGRSEARSASKVNPSSARGRRRSAHLASRGRTPRATPAPTGPSERG